MTTLTEVDVSDGALYFTHQWILDKKRAVQFPLILKQLVIASQQFSVPLAIERDVTLEGLEVMEFTVQVPSEEVVNRFVTYIMPYADFLKWSQLPAEQASTKTFPDLNGYDAAYIDNDDMAYMAMEGLWNAAHRNEELLLKLRFHSPMYYRRDWVIYDVDADAWVHDLMESLWRGGSLGAELRFSKEIQGAGAVQCISITVRLYSESELAAFSKEVDARLGAGEWITVTRKYFS